MVIRSIKPDEYDICLDLWDKAFEETPRSYFKRYFYGDPWFKPEYTRVCEDNGRIVSAVQIVRREVRFGNETLVMGGIANVGTLPDFRGKGYSSAILKSAIDVMERDGMAFSMLYTGINPFYERVGYSTIDIMHGAASLKPRLKPIDRPYHIRAYKSEDAEAVVSIYNDFNSNIMLSAVRNPQYLNGFALNVESESFDVWVAEHSGEVAGYLVGQKFKKPYGIAEICCRKEHEDSLKLLAHMAYTRAIELHADELVYRLPLIDAINAALSEIAIPLKPRTYTYMMMKVLNLNRMFGRMLPELSKRAERINSAANVTISVEDIGCITLNISPGSVTISAKQSDTRIGLNQYQLLNLVFGYRDPKDILPVRPGAELLAAIFPLKMPIYYNVDSF